MLAVLAILGLVALFAGYAVLANWLYQKGELTWFVFLNFVMFVIVVAGGL